MSVRTPSRPSPIAVHVVALRRSVRSVLARPLTSFHLVVGLLAVLTGLGLVMVLSASEIDSFERTGSAYSTFAHQIAYCALGLVLFAVGLRTPPARLRAASPWLVVGSVAALVAVLVPGLGSSVAGAQKWFSVAGMSVQPSEPAKLALVLWGAHVLTARRHHLDRAHRALLPVDRKSNV